jgi:hypothetical protein
MVSVLEIILNFSLVVAVDALKHKVIKRYKEFLKEAQKGYQTDYKDILDMICFIKLPL